MTSTAILIPARYSSSRFPGKPLTDLGGIPMIQRVVKECLKSPYDVYVLTDHKLIAHAAKLAGASVYIDYHDYNNGTERIAGALESTLFNNYDTFVNVQGDMPDIRPDMIEAVLKNVQSTGVSTLATEMPETRQFDPNSVKIIYDYQKEALWCGRGLTYGDWHLGVYAYERFALDWYDTTGECEEEVHEGLEQLRFIKGGLRPHVTMVEWNGIEINTPQDAGEWNG